MASPTEPSARQHTIDMGASMETEEGLAIIDALNDVSDVLAMDGPRVTFVGEGPVQLGAIGRLAAVDAYRCARGVFLFLQEQQGPHWAAAGASLSEALTAIHEDDVRSGVKRETAGSRLLTFP